MPEEESRFVEMFLKLRQFLLTASRKIEGRRIDSVKLGDSLQSSFDELEDAKLSLFKRLAGCSSSGFWFVDNFRGR